MSCVRMSQATSSVRLCVPFRGASGNVLPSLEVWRPRRGARSVHGLSSVAVKARHHAGCKARGGKRKHLSPGFGRIHSSDSESRAVNIAIGSNVLIFAAKVWVSSNSGSSALFAEAVHTLADIGNQLLLRFGIARSTKAPTKEYPYGYMKEKFIFSLISAVGVFCIGAGASVINGAYALTDQDHDVDNFGLNFAVLAMSFVVEGFSCVVAVRALSEGAERRGVTFAEYLDSGSDPAAVAVMAEDGAAVMGVTIAAISNWLVKATDWQAWDGLGSILVGVLLSLVALFLIQRNRAVLIGRSMAADELAIVLAYLYADPVVNHVYDARSEEIGPGVYRFSAELDFDGEKIAERHLKTVNPEQLAHKFFNTQNPVRYDDTRAFSIALREYGAQLVRAVGSEVDRIEGDIQNLVPGVRYVDLEADRGRFWLYRASVDGDDDIRERFDISQLSLDAVAWQNEETKINYLLSLDDGDDDTEAASAADAAAEAAAEGGPSGEAVASAVTDATTASMAAERNGGSARAAGSGEGSAGRDTDAEGPGHAAVEAGEASVVSWDEPPAGAAPAAAGNGAGDGQAALDPGGAGSPNLQDAAQQSAKGQMTVIVGAASKTGKVLDVELGDEATAADEAARDAPPMTTMAEGPAPATPAGSGTDSGAGAEAAAPVAEQVGAGAKGSQRQ